MVNENYFVERNTTKAIIKANDCRPIPDIKKLFDFFLEMNSGDCTDKIGEHNYVRNENTVMDNYIVP
jgi:hypothetical protein